MNTTPDLQFNCPACGQPIAADAAWVGQQGSCPSCDKVLTIPGPILLVKPVPTKDCPLCGSPSPITATWCEKCGRYFDDCREEKVVAPPPKPRPIFLPVFLGVFCAMALVAVAVVSWNARSAERGRQLQLHQIEQQAQVESSSRYDQRMDAARQSHLLEQEECLGYLRELATQITKLPVETERRAYEVRDLCQGSVQHLIMAGPGLDLSLRDDLERIAAKIQNALNEIASDEYDGKPSNSKERLRVATTIPGEVSARIDKTIAKLKQATDTH